MRPVRCEKEIELIEAEQLWAVLSTIVAILFCFLVYYGYHLSKINREKILGKEGKNKTSVIIKESYESSRDKNLDFKYEKLAINYNRKKIE